MDKHEGRSKTAGFERERSKKCAALGADTDRPSKAAQTRATSNTRRLKDVRAPFRRIK